MIIYEFLYCDCIHESAYATMSLHRTREGAVKAMEAHKAKELEKFTKTKGLIHEGYVNDKELSLVDKAYLIEDNAMCKFGVHQDWQVGEQELLD